MCLSFASRSTGEHFSCKQIIGGGVCVLGPPSHVNDAHVHNRPRLCSTVCRELRCTDIYDKFAVRLCLAVPDHTVNRESPTFLDLLFFRVVCCWICTISF